MASVSDADWQLTKKSVLERNKHMFNNPLMSDVTFTCGGSERKSFYAHKYVLATSSPVFYAMFYGDLAETNSVIHLPDIDEESLEVFLRFLYTDEFPTSEEVLALKVIYCAKKYIVPSLEEKCWEIVDNNASKALETDLFPTIDRSTLEDLLKRDTLEVSGGGGEIKLIEATLKWCDYQCSSKGLESSGENRRAVLGSAVNHLRFLALTQEEFAKYVSESGLLTESQMIAFFKKFSGMTTPGLTCSLPSRKGHSNIHSFVRFAQGDLMKPDKIRWNYLHRNEDGLAFIVNKPVLFHGIRLFGNANGGKYEVRMRQPVAFCQTYTSTSISEDVGNCYGFDVMFPDPVKLLNCDQFCNICLEISGPKSYYGVNSKSNIELDGISVKFSDFDYSCYGYTSNGTDSKRGQIHGVFISRYYNAERN